ncbi:MAG: DUF5115 domain-containing protein [Bacteroidales bacterium]|nr:DUF5115 domain-containing protein [Bacteroidales bacterium]
MKKLVYSTLALAALGFSACEDESYNDWASPVINAQEAAQSVKMTVADAAAINFEGLTGDSVKVFVPSIAVSDEAASFTNYAIEFANGVVLYANANGEVLASELKDVVESIYGKAPVERTLEATATAYISNNGQSVKTDPEKIAVKVTLVAPIIEDAYYVIGDYPGWDFKAAATAKFCRADESVSVYDDPVFTITVPAPTNEDGERVDYWFRFLSQSALDAADWSGTIGAVENGLSDLEGSLYFKDEGGHGDACIKMLASDGAKFYKIELNMMDYRYKITPLSFEEYIYVPGNAQGWKPETAAALKHEGEGIYKGFVVMDGDFKFTRERAWAAEYNAGDFKTVSEGLDVSAGAGQNIKYTGERALYHFTVDVVNGSIEATKIEYMGVTGDFAGWNEGVKMTWDDENLCFVLENAGVTEAGWKFRANGLTDPDWKINLGGDLADLSYGGSNIAVVGSTVKLYPCRTTSDKFYATVE